MTQTSSKYLSLYQRLGKEPAISLVVQKFYEIMLKDQRVAGYFAKTDMTKQTQKQIKFITLVTGGPNNYEGTDMKTAHCKHAIGNFQFDATWQNLQVALEFYHVLEKEKNQLKEIFYSVKDDIVTEKKQQAKMKCPFSEQNEAETKQQQKEKINKSLFDKLGGKQAISLVVNKFYEIMLQDERVKDYFSETSMEKQIKSQKQFITMVTGGQNQYQGKDMKSAHCPFAIGQFQFDATWQNLQNALKCFDVPKQYQNELKQIFYSVQSEIVNSDSKVPLKCPKYQKANTIAQQTQKQNIQSYLPLTHQKGQKKCPFSQGKFPLNQEFNSHMKQYFKRKIRLQFLQKEQKEGRIPQKLKNSVYQNIFY